jgi:hypothetical protein
VLISIILILTAQVTVLYQQQRRTKAQLVLEKIKPKSNENLKKVEALFKAHPYLNDLTDK